MMNPKLNSSFRKYGTASEATAGQSCHACERMIMRGEQITWVPRREKASHRFCDSVEPEREPINIPAASGLDAFSERMIEIAQDTVTSATAQIIAIAQAQAKQSAIDAFDALPPKRIEIVRDGILREVKGKTHKQFETLLKLVSLGCNVWIYGAAGGGKTTVCAQVADALGLDFAHISLNVQSQASLMMGYRDANGNYVSTEFRKVYENGGVFLIDEYDNASGNLLTSLNTAFANGSCAFPDGNVKRHKDALFIAASNTAGNGANATYNTRQKIDGASRERFIFLEWEYDTQLEKSLSLAINPTAQPWLTWVLSARETVARLSLPVLVTPRASIEGSRLLLAGFNPLDVAKMVVFKGIDQDTQNKVIANVSLPR